MPDESQEIEQLNIDITATNEKATTKIEEVKKSLSSLKRAINNFGKLDMSGFEQSIGKISDSLSGLKGATKNLSDIKNRLNDVSRAVPKIADLDTTRAEGNINKLTVSVKHLAQQCERLAKSDIVGTLRDLSKINFSRLDGVTRKTKKKQQEMSTASVPVMNGELVPVGKPYYSGTRPEYKPRNFNVASTAEIEELRAWAKKHKEEQDKIFSQQQKDAKKHATETNKFRAQEDRARKGLLDSVTNYKKQEEKRVKEQKKLLKAYTAPVKNILKSFGRIAFYRFVRSIIKIITDSVKQGIGMAYSFSSENGGQFSKTMDNLTTSINYLRSSLGSLISNVLIALEPLITNLINGSVDFINNLSQAFAYMAKQDTWLKAIRVESEYSDVATGVAAANKKLKQSFLGIDEINVLGDTQTKLFDYEVVPVDVEKAEETSNTLNGIASSITAIAIGLGTIKTIGTIANLLGITSGTASTISGVSSALAGSGVGAGVGAASGGLAGAVTTVAGAAAALATEMSILDSLNKGADEAVNTPEAKEKLYDAGKTGSDWNIFWTGFAESWDEWFQKNGLIWNPIFGVMQGIFGGQEAVLWQEDAAKGRDEYEYKSSHERWQGKNQLTIAMMPFLAEALKTDPNDKEKVQSILSGMTDSINNLYTLTEPLEMPEEYKGLWWTFSDKFREGETYINSVLAPFAAAASLIDPNDTEATQALADAMAKALQNAMMGITINIDGKKVSESVTVNQTSNGRRKGEVVSVY